MRNASEIIKAIEHQFYGLQAAEGGSLQREDVVLYISRDTLRALRSSGDLCMCYQARDIWMEHLCGIRLYVVATDEDIAHVCKKP